MIILFKKNRQTKKRRRSPRRRKMAQKKHPPPRQNQLRRNRQLRRNPRPQNHLRVPPGPAVEAERPNVPAPVCSLCSPRNRSPNSRRSVFFNSTPSAITSLHKLKKKYFPFSGLPAHGPRQRRYPGCRGP